MRRQLSAHRTRLWLLQSQLRAGQLRQIRSHPSRLSQWRAHAKPPEARGSQAQADQDQRRNARRESSFIASCTATKVSSRRPRRSLRDQDGTRVKRAGDIASPFFLRYDASSWGGMNLDLTPEFESLRFSFQTICERFEKAETHEEKLELVAISKEIIWEARWQIADYRAAFR
jgi:hypothetical protein